MGEGHVDLLVGVGEFGGPSIAEACGEDGVFHGAGTSEAPTVVGYGLDEAGFHGAFGGERFLDALAVLEVGRLVIGREDEDLAGQAMSIGIESATVSGFHFGYDRSFSHKWFTQLS